MKYYTERAFGPIPRTLEELTPSAWKGLVGLVQTLVRTGAFGHSFPEECLDGNEIIGTDWSLFANRLQGEVPWLTYPLNGDKVPDTAVALDLIEFCFCHVSCPIRDGYHGFAKHYHLRFDKDKGQTEFRQDVNQILARNGVAFELGVDGQVQRLGPPVLRDQIGYCVFDTGDQTLNSLLESARSKFLDPDVAVRRESLEKLWDAWERLKTICPGKDKKASVSVLLDKGCLEPNLRGRLEQEACELTDIGNKFHIRHAETN